MQKLKSNLKLYIKEFGRGLTWTAGMLAVGGLPTAIIIMTGKCITDHGIETCLTWPHLKESIWISTILTLAGVGLQSAIIAGMAVAASPILIVVTFGPAWYSKLYPNSATRCIQWTTENGVRARYNNPYMPGSFYCEEHGRAKEM